MTASGGNRRGRLVVISAPSGGGKTSLTRALVERLAHAGRRTRFSVSHTTRAPRAGEVDGRHYHFVAPDVFAEMVARGAFLEHARVFEHCYGTAIAEAERGLAAGEDVMLDIDWQGARQVRAAAPGAVTIFIRPPSRAALEQRLRARASDSEADIARRLAAADDEMSHANEFDHVIVNDRFERALDALVALFERSAQDSAALRSG